VKDYQPGSALYLSEELHSMRIGLRTIDRSRGLTQEDREKRRIRVYAKAASLGLELDAPPIENPSVDEAPMGGRRVCYPDQWYNEQVLNSRALPMQGGVED